MPQLKKDAPQDLIDTLDEIEFTADQCWRELRLMHYPSNTASWALLVSAVSFVERHRQRLAPNTPYFDAMLGNLSRTIAIGLKWTAEHAAAPAPGVMAWETSLGAAVDQAIAVANGYSHFEVCFQGFHKDLYAAELLAPIRVRFTVAGSTRSRQVSAFQKYSQLRPGPVGTIEAVAQPEPPRVRELLESTLRACRRVSPLQFEYGEPWDLWREMFLQTRQRLSGLMRRAADLSLGALTLEEFNEVYAAIITACSAHDFLCFRWGQSVHAYPLESAVMMRTRTAWVDVLSGLSGIAREKCAGVLSDLVFDRRRSVDLHIHPFVQVDEANDVLAVAPPFPLHGNHEENVLRVCSQRRPQVFDTASLAKQSEMLASLRSTAGRYYLQGAVTLPAQNPDIDLIVADDGSSTVVFAELKWIRKPVRALEIPDRDADLLKGVEQLRLIRGFLRDNPTYLSALGRLPRPLTEYEHVHFCLIARDHWRWVDPCDGIATVQFDMFSSVVTRSNDLRAAMDELLRYEWLPVEGKNFAVRFETAMVNGVSLESEVFYATWRAR